MKPMKILVPIDFSKHSLNGLHAAIDIVNAAGGEILMMYVQKKPNNFYGNNTKILIEKANEKFEEIVAKYKKSLKCAKLKYKVRQGKVFEELVNQAKYMDANMIVCSTHGASGLSEYFIGSNAYRLVMLADCPVLTVRQYIKTPKPFEKILVPIDSTLETRQKVPMAATMAKLFNSEVHVLGLIESNYEEHVKRINNYVNQVAKYLKEHDINYIVKTVTESHVADTTLDYATENEMNLICITTEQENTISNILLGPAAQQIINHSIIPVLSVHSRELVRDSYVASLPALPY